MLNEKLKELRKIYKVKQIEIANFLKITQSCYSMYEKGIRKPDYEIIKKICIYYDITSDELLEIDTERKKQNFINSFNGNFNNSNINIH